MTDNKIELNPNMQYILCGDISASMGTLDPKCADKPRYEYMLEKFKSFIQEASDFDPDGPTVILFGESVYPYPNTTLDVVDSKISKVQFEGFTNTHLVLAEAWKQHLQEKQDLTTKGKTHGGTVCFIFTDGQPTNEKALERQIVEIANTVDTEDEFNIGFILVGTIDSRLADYLEHLDNGLGLKYDIVGNSPLESTTFLKAVNTAVNE